MRLESLSDYRDGGRLQNYLGNPPLSAGAFVVFRRPAHDVGHSLEAAFAPGDPVAARGDTLLALAGMTLEEIAAGVQSLRSWPC